MSIFATLSKSLYLLGFIDFCIIYYVYITFMLQIVIFYFFPLANLPPTLFPSSWSSAVMSLVVTILFLSVVAIFSATNSGSMKSISILAGDEAKFAPWCHYCFKEALACSCEYYYIFVWSCIFSGFYYWAYEVSWVSVIIYIVVFVSCFYHSGHVRVITTMSGSYLLISEPITCGCLFSGTFFTIALSPSLL